MVFNEEGKFLRRIGCDNVTNFPNGIDISDAGDILIGDSHGNRFHVAVFSRDGSLISEFECPYVKVNLNIIGETEMWFDLFRFSCCYSFVILLFVFLFFNLYNY